MKRVSFEAAPGVRLDLIDLPLPMEGYHDFFGIWLLRDETRGRSAVVDVGPTSTASLLIEELHRLGVRRLDYVLLTHIHLDHSGGLAEVLRAFPSARVAVHPKGKPHLVNPERLWNSSLEVIPDMALAYGEPSPVEDNLFIPEETPIPGVIAIDTPGHAPHHRSFLYETPGTGILFAGEAASTYSRLDHLVPGAEPYRYLLRPASPPRFYIDTALDSIEKLKALETSVMCYAHFGFTREVNRMLTEAGKQIGLWRGLIMEFLETKGLVTATMVNIDELMAFLIERDPRLSDFPMLPEDIRSREMGFMASSTAGFLQAVVSEKDQG